MKLYLFVFCLFLLQSVTGQVVPTGSLQLFSKESLDFADKSLTAVDKPYKVIYIPVLYFAMPPEGIIDEKTTVTQLLDGEVAGSDYLQQALTEQQAVDLITAKNYFGKLEDNANTILVLDNIVQTTDVVDENTRIKHLEGRQFVFGDGIPASVRQVITGYSPAAQLDFNDQTLAANDKYLEEYTSILITTINRNGEGSFVVEVYPKMIPLLIMMVDGIGYVHADPTAGLANLTNEEQEKLKNTIKSTIPNLEEVNLTPIDYKLQDKDFPIYRMAMVYAYKGQKTDDYRLIQNKEAKRTWKLNDNIMETVLAIDRVFQFTAFISKKDAPSKYTLKEGENIFTISSDVGTTFVKKNQTTTFEIKFAYNSNKFFIKAAINGKDPVRFNFDEIVGDEDGHPTLKVGDELALYLFKQEGEEEKAVSAAMWTTDNEKFVTADHYPVKIVDGDNDIMVKPGKDDNISIVKFSYQKPVVNDIEYSFVNINVDALATEDSKNNAKELFKEALKSIKSKNKALSEYFVNNNARIQSYVLPGNDPLLARPDDNNTVLLGFANKQLTATYRANFLDVINIKTTKKGIIQDATLVVRLYGIDRQTLIDASAAQTAEGKAIAEPILTRLANTDKNMSDKVRGLIQSGQLTDAELNDCYELVPDAPNVLSSYFGGMATKKLMYLNYDGILALDTKPPVTTQNRFTSITAHEMMHIYFTSTNFYSVLKWCTIRDKQSEHKYSFGKSDCSKADGHEEYNPEDQKTCDEQKRYIPESTGSGQL